MCGTASGGEAGRILTQRDGRAGPAREHVRREPFSGCAVAAVRAGLTCGSEAVDGFAFVVGVREAGCSAECVAVDDDGVFEVVDGAGRDVGEAQAADA